MAEDFLKLAIRLGMLSEQDAGSPKTANSDKNIDTNLPPYAADDEARKRRQTLIRRLKKMLKDRDERLADHEIKRAIQAGDHDETEGDAQKNEKKKFLKSSEFRKRTSQVEINPEKEILNNL